ncbi:hypothetical protein D1646_05335 [Pseudoflavonifractor sp. 60]|uniref:hypothetical protein n=1 Tax=Pseudoflavonifractor sp. 60 TaxID=2304576 RepID=UPI00137214FE|nr:hypothetical protein [Pseudoflavonifractor sp. 60]NBI66246.1 hypothetical protein [Pseudoflavonifractor sp. 60]
MNPFQSNNIWKRAAREKKKAENPDTAEQIQRKLRNSTALWLVGGVVIFVLLLTGLQWGVLPLNVENIVILSIIGLYTLYNGALLGNMSRKGRKK